MRRLRLSFSSICIIIIFIFTFFVCGLSNLLGSFLNRANLCEQSYRKGKDADGAKRGGAVVRLAHSVVLKCLRLCFVDGEFVEAQVVVAAGVDVDKPALGRETDGS